MASPLVDVYVKLPSGRTSVLQLMPHDRVSKINEHVGKEESVPDDRIILKYQGKVLERSKTVSGYGIRPETILKGEIVRQKDITVYVKMPDGSSISVNTRNTSPVSDILQYLEDNSSVEIDKHHLKANGQILSKTKLLFASGIAEESILTLEEKTSPASSSSTANKIQEEASEELKETVLSSFDTGGKNVEVVFSFDTTGSMSAYLDTVRANLKETCQRLLRDIPNIRIGIIAHGDYCDYNNYVIRHIDLTSNVDDLVKFAQDTPSTGGGDAPECYEWVLHKSQQLDWSEDSAKALVVIGDCEPHPPSYTDQKINWWTELDVLKGMDVKVYGVYCSTGTSPAQSFYEEISEQTGGCMLKLKHFSLITEMFLGVCYNEAAPEQLEAFTEELKQEGKLTEDAKNLMQEIADKKPKNEDKTKKKENRRHVNESWWDVSKDENRKTSCPRYYYNVENDKWGPPPNAQKTVARSISAPSSAPSSSVKRGKSTKKTGCTVM